ncbi:MAG: rhodanese-like domain-containing protein [Euryarchaeota archaeon]|nr:rhodanese-like domain-containing protein [Euryarchaeota archaeon]
MVETIDARRAHDMLDQGEVVLLDVMPRESYERLHIPKAVNVPYFHDRFDERAQHKLPEKDAKVIVYASEAKDEEGAKAAKRLESLGFPHVYHLSDGLQAWREEGYTFSGGGLEREPRM